MRKFCSVVGCGVELNSHNAKGLCSGHYQRMRHGKGLRPIHRPNASAWLLAHVAYDGDECLKWPFATMKSGRGIVHFEGKRRETARLMCRLAHGEPTTPKHEAAHSCGKGHEGCINQTHLSWKTPKENHSDMVTHGTSPVGERHPQVTLTERKVIAIREFSNDVSQKALADLFGTTASNISAIVRRESWRHI